MLVRSVLVNFAVSLSSLVVAFAKFSSLTSTSIAKATVMGQCAFTISAIASTALVIVMLGSAMLVDQLRIARVSGARTRIWPRVATLPTWWARQGGDIRRVSLLRSLRVRVGHATVAIRVLANVSLVSLICCICCLVGIDLRSERLL